MKKLYKMMIENIRGILFTLSIIGCLTFSFAFVLILKDKAIEDMKECDSKNATEIIPIYSFSLMNINEGSIHGSFLYTYGNYNEETYYVFYQTLEDGGKKLLKIPSKSSIIYNDEDDNPYIAKKTICAYKFPLPTENSEYKIHTPQNAIKQEYNGDLSNLK